MPDPMAEMNRRSSPYVYGRNNPLRFIDPDGMLDNEVLLASKNFVDWSRGEGRFAMGSDEDRFGDEDPTAWLQNLLNYFGWGVTSPKDSQEASEQNDRRSKLYSKNAEVESNIKTAENIPIAGGLLKMSRGATGTFSDGKDYGAVFSGGASIFGDIFGGAAARSGLKFISKDVLGHIFRNAVGHVNPSTAESMVRYIKLFENVANDVKNINPNVLSSYQRGASGFQGFAQTFQNGKQVWVQTFNGKIINAGVNVTVK